MTSEKNQGKRKEYRRGFAIALGIFILGSLLEWVTGGRGMSLPSWPVNVFLALTFAFLIAFIHFAYRGMPTVRWLSRVPASISAISLFTLLTLILGLSKQNEPDAPAILKMTGLDHIRHSYTFLLSGLYLLVTLGLVIMRRLKNFTYRNIGFLLNHLGLWIIVMAGSLGAGDLIRLHIYANENEPVWYGFNMNRQPRDLPFTIKLLDFDIEYYPPKIAYIESASMSLPEGIDNNMTLIEDSLLVQIANWDIFVEEFYPAALPDSNGVYQHSNDSFAIPVVKVRAVNTIQKNVVSGYITCGGFRLPHRFLPLNERYSLAMSLPEASEYSSLLEIMKADGETDTTRLIVNEPVKVDGWNLYQQSYDERMGKWSRLSVIEAIKDPWLPMIYLGIFMVIAGALYLFTIGKTPKEE